MTKRDILNSALSKLLNKPPLPPTGGAESLDNSALSIAYDHIVPAEISKYDYVFSFDSMKLQTPIELDDSKYPINLTDSRYYQKPVNSGNIFGVLPAEQVHQALQYLTTGNDQLQRRFTTITHSELPDDVIRVGSTQTDLYLLYIDLFPSPSVMSPSFRSAIIYYLVSDVAARTPKLGSVSRNINYWVTRGDNEIAEARRLNFKKASPPPPSATLDDYIYRGKVDGTI